MQQFEYFSITAVIVFAYLIGSIPTSVWVGRVFYGVDVREQGSGNAGATNTIRVLGAKAGIPVLLIDVMKGWFAVYLGNIFAPVSMTPEQIVNLKILLGLVVTLGHIFPVYVGFKGGKGVATLVGVLVALYPDTILIVVGVFILIFLIFQYVSLASILAAISFPFAVYYSSADQYPALILFAIIIALFIPFTHKKNIRRLLVGQENKFRFRRTKV
jgi:glycerol-3-phosphate acyltransferase PlsY